MICPKCSGLMVYEKFFDYLDDTGTLGFSGWRCIICGKIFDHVIDANRRSRTQVFISKARRKFKQALSDV